MADFTELIEEARRLGTAIAQHPVAQAYAAAQHAVQSDDATRTLLSEYQSVAHRIQELTAQQKPIEVDDKHKLSECEQKLAGNDGFKALLRAETDYVDMMNRINTAMQEPIAKSGKNDGVPG